MSSKKQTIIIVSLTSALVAYQWLFGIKLAWAMFPFLIGAGVYSIKSIPFLLNAWIDFFKVFGLKLSIHQHRSYFMNFLVFLLIYTIASIAISHKNVIDPIQYFQSEFIKNTVFMLVGFLSNIIAHFFIPVIKPRGSKLSYVIFGLIVFTSTTLVVHVAVNLLTTLNIEVF